MTGQSDLHFTVITEEERIMIKENNALLKRLSSAIIKGASPYRTPKEAAAYLGCSVQQLMVNLKERIGYIKDKGEKGAVKFDINDLEAYMKKNRVAPSNN